MKYFITLFLLLGSLSVQASKVEDGGNAGNGGHPIGLEFLRMAVMVVDDVSKQSSRFKEVNIHQLKAIISDKNLKVTVSTTELWVIDDEGKRISVPAKNIPALNKIEIHESSWLKLNRPQKLGLIFHEILGLAGLEKTGEYHISSRYQEIPNAGYNDVIMTKSPIPLIPAKAVSCYSQKITPENQRPVQDVMDGYIRIPTVSFFRSNTSKDLIISNIRITYAIPGSGNNNPEAIKCEVSGDSLRALSSYWWRQGVEAIIPASPGQGSDVFSTDCAIYCGGIRDVSDNFTTTGDVEVFGLERDPSTGDESPVKMTRSITIKSF